MAAPFHLAEYPGFWVLAEWQPGLPETLR